MSQQLQACTASRRKFCSLIGALEPIDVEENGKTVQVFKEMLKIFPEHRSIWPQMSCNLKKKILLLDVSCLWEREKKQI